MKKVTWLIGGCLLALSVGAQVDTTSYPDERRELTEFLRRPGPGQEKACADWIAVGPKGDISFTRKEWQAAQEHLQLRFKSFRVVPGSEIVRVYERHCGVVNFLAEVTLLVSGKEMTIHVRRLEVYHRSASGWCMVAGQGTQVDETLFPLP